MSTPRPTDPAPAVVDLDGISLQPLEPDHAPLVVQLMEQRGHRYILDLRPNVQGIRSALSMLAGQTWTLPLAAIRGTECIGMATTALPNVKSLSASFTALFVDPAESTLPLAMFIRHLLWNFPLHRLYAHIPAMDLTREYVELLGSVGFVEEGTLQQHLVAAGQRFDVHVLGLLRPDFDAWAAANEPRLRLT